MKARIAAPGSSWWLEIMEGLDIDYKEVKKLAFSEEINDQLKADAALAHTLGVQSGVAILVNNVRLFRVNSVTPDDLKKLLDL